MKKSLMLALQEALRDKLVSTIDDMIIVTDRLEYAAADQVIPLFVVEQQFFLDELQRDRLPGASVLEIGLGSGVLSIAAARAGAKHVTALEINPRAKNFAGFNILLNAMEGKITVVHGNEQIYQPVAGQRFDYIISNPPSEPTPPGLEYFHHSSSGLYGLDFIDQVFQGLDDHLTSSGHAQIVTAAPGNREEPSLLLDLIRRRLSGTTSVLLGPPAITFEAQLHWLTTQALVANQTEAAVKVDVLRRQAAKDQVTHMHMCVIHYDKGVKQLQVARSPKLYDHDWGKQPAPAEV